jgi:hypothetical protein
VGASDQRISDLVSEVECLKRQMRQQRQLTRNLYAWVDTVSSPLFKRLWWAVAGYRFHRLGRWYKPDKDHGWPVPDRYKT